MIVIRSVSINPIEVVENSLQGRSVLLLHWVELWGVAVGSIYFTIFIHHIPSNIVGGGLD